MQKSRLIVPAAIALLCALAPLSAQKPAAPKPVRVDLSKEKEGGEPSRFLSVVGDWSIAADGGKKVLLVDGRQWKKGPPSTARATRSSSTT
jgi:hypothetical protein